MTTVAVILHGGKPHSLSPVPWFSASWLRMWDLGRAIAHLVRRRRLRGIGVVLVRNSVRGWNDGAEHSALSGARWVLDEISRQYPAAGVVLVGHSMGGRVACALADYPTVRGVVGLAPWLPGTAVTAGEPASPEAMLFSDDQALAVAHGTNDRWCPPAQSLSMCERTVAADVPTIRAEMTGAGHFLLRAPQQWRRFTALSVVAMAQRVGPFDPAHRERDGDLHRSVQGVIDELGNTLGNTLKS